MVSYLSKFHLKSDLKVQQRPRVSKWFHLLLLLLDTESSRWGVLAFSEHLLHVVSHQLLISPSYFPICPSSLSTVTPPHPSLPPVPHYYPPTPTPTPTSAQGCQSFRDAVSCEIAQIAVALRLAQQQRGGGGRVRGAADGEKQKRGRDFMLQHF